MSLITMKPFVRRRSLPFAISALAILCLVPAALLSGCGNQAPVVKLDDAVETTEDTLTEALLGPQDVPETDPVPREKPLLRKGVYDSVLIAADEKGFVRLSHNKLHESDVKDIEERVTRTVDKRISKRGFSARRVDYPIADADISAAVRPLAATLLPAVEDAGSPKDHAEGKARQLILVHLVISDPKTGAVFAARDYYSGSDVPNDHDGEHGDHGGNKFHGGAGWREVPIPSSTPGG